MIVYSINAIPSLNAIFYLVPRGCIYGELTVSYLLYIYDSISKNLYIKKKLIKKFFIK